MGRVSLDEGPEPRALGPATEYRLNSSPVATAVVLTLNEEREIESCLAAIPDNLVKIVIDSGSTDRTVEIATRMGAKVFHKPWNGFADQRNFALRECGVDTEWVLFVDADERYPAPFFEWMRRIIDEDPAVDAYQVPSILHLDGRPLRHAPGYPIYHPRLVRRSVAFEVNHMGHGETLAPCRTRPAPIGYDHYYIGGSLRPWLKVQLGRAQIEADARIKPTTSRGRLAQMIPASPLRALARFVYHYVWRMGFLDGRAGLQFALMFTWYELTVYLAREPS